MPCCKISLYLEFHQNCFLSVKYQIHLWINYWQIINEKQIHSQPNCHDDIIQSLVAKCIHLQKIAWFWKIHIFATQDATRMWFSSDVSEKFQQFCYGTKLPPPEFPIKWFGFCTKALGWVFLRKVLYDIHKAWLTKRSNFSKTS